MIHDAQQPVSVWIGFVGSRQSSAADRRNIKIALCVFCMWGVASGESDSAAEKPREVRAAIAEELKREFRFEPRQSVAQPVTETEVVILPRFRVLGSRPVVARMLRDEKEKREEEKFSWQKGGTILKSGRVTVMVKYDPEYHTFSFLNFSF